MYSMSEEEREEMGRKGMAHVEKNYNFANFEKEWVELMESVHEKYGSWENRKNFKNWHLVEIK